MPSWLGGGLAAVCGGLWLAFTVLRRDRGAPPGRSSGGDGGGGPRPGGGVTVTNGLSGGNLMLLVLALFGAVVLVAALAGNRVNVDRGVGIGGDATESDIRIETP